MDQANIPNMGLCPRHMTEKSEIMECLKGDRNFFMR